MKFNATIFVEGEWDKKFLKDFVKSRFSFDLPSEAVQITGGKEALHTKKESLQISTYLRFKNLVILDANGSYVKSKDFLEKQRNDLQVDFDFFLVPNNKDVGDLETLLENIANPVNQFVLDCFEDYIKCLKKSDQHLNYPGSKTKIYAYLDLLNEKTKPHLVNYQNTKLWQLDSPYLLSFYNFLKPYFSE